MPRSTSPSARPLLANSTHPTFWENAFDDGIKEDDPIWKEYVEAATASDTRMVENWNKILDVILVFVSAHVL